MKYEVKTVRDAALFSLSGKWMGDKHTSNLYDEAKSLIGKGFKNIIMDLRQVEYINSIGLGVIIAVRTTSIKAGGNLKLICESDKVLKYFKITDLDKFFEIFTNEDEALASFGEG